MSLRQQAMLFNSASVVILVHGAAMANWVFLPINAVGIHIAHQGHYKALHSQAEHLVNP